MYIHILLINKKKKIILKNYCEVNTVIEFRCSEWRKNKKKTVTLVEKRADDDLVLETIEERRL